MRAARGSALPVSGRGVGVAIVDTGIDGLHPDLRLGENVAQTVVSASMVEPCAAVGYFSGADDLPRGFVPPHYVLGLPYTEITDHAGHGTLVAGVVAGSGAASAGLYRGVTPGAHLVSLAYGNACGTVLSAALQSFDWILANQYRYNLRVVSNSWGLPPPGVFDARTPLNVATRILHDKSIVVLFAAGNSGNIPDAINPASTMPWTISVGAGAKNGWGAPAHFSSQGNDDGTGYDVAGDPADPTRAPNLRPDLIAPGEALITACEPSRGCVPALYVPDGRAREHLPYYSPASGTSFSTPFVAGVVALMLEANPRLRPDGVVTILRNTATPMPDPPRVVGAGYVDAHNAVRRALRLARVPHPADLDRPRAPDGPVITDEPDVLYNNGALAPLDILSADVRCDAVRDELAYTIEIANYGQRLPNYAWRFTSSFGDTAIYVEAFLDEKLRLHFDHGTLDGNAAISSGVPDAGSILGNVFEIRLSRARLNALAGIEVLGTLSRSVHAKSLTYAPSRSLAPTHQVHDTATGRDFVVE